MLLYASKSACQALRWKGSETQEKVYMSMTAEIRGWIDLLLRIPQFKIYPSYYLVIMRPSLSKSQIFH